MWKSGRDWTERYWRAELRRNSKKRKTTGGNNNERNRKGEKEIERFNKYAATRSEKRYTIR